MPVDGGSGGGVTDEQLRWAMARCGPGDALAECLAGLRSIGVQPEITEGRPAGIAIGGSFPGVTFDARGGATIVDVAFTAADLPPDLRSSIALFLETHAGAFGFSEPCPAFASFCGVLYPKQKGGAAAIEIGLGLVGVSGAPSWRKPPAARVHEGIYRKDELLLDVGRTASRALVVQFSLPLDPAGKPSKRQQLLRPAFDQFARSAFVRAR